MLAAAAVITLLPATAASAADRDAVEPNVVCQYDESYAPNRRDSDDHIKVSPTFQNTNNTSQTATSTFTSTSTGTVSLSVSASATVKAGVIVSGVEVTIGIDVSTTLSVSVSNSISVPTPPHSTTYAQYGVFRARTPGTYYKFAMTPGCSSSSFSAYARSPRTIGWLIWQG
jgi:hypothetical protein